MSNNADTEPDASRPARFISHALVEVRKFRHLPFFIDSAILLDMSVAGFKIEFTGKALARGGDTMWIQIPLYPLGIKGPKYLVSKVEVKWFDEERMRMGGIFVDIDRSTKQVVEQVVSRLKESGQRI